MPHIQDHTGVDETFHVIPDAALPVDQFHAQTRATMCDDVTGSQMHQYFLKGGRRPSNVHHERQTALIRDLARANKGFDA